MIWIVSHDAGGAEILASWILREKGLAEFCCVVDGPAKKIFSRKIPGGFSSAPFPSFRQELKSSDLVLTGSGWGSDLEFNAILAAKEKGARSATWIDHWVNYPLRFRRGDRQALPDEIWVSDEFQEAIALRELPGVKVLRRENPYFSEILEEWAKFSPHLSRGGEHRFLFVGEALSEAKPEWKTHPVETWPEIVCFRRFLELAQRGKPGAVLRIRPHPAESREKYASSLSQTNLLWEWSEGNTLLADCAWADEVVGISSMGLVIALLGRKPVLSMRLEPGWQCPIPLPGIRLV